MNPSARSIPKFDADAGIAGAALEGAQNTVFIVTHSVEEAIYWATGYCAWRKPGRLVEILKLPRPDMSPEMMRKKPWFNELSQELLRRLEMDAPASGELPGIDKWR